MSTVVRMACSFMIYHYRMRAINMEGPRAFAHCHARSVSFRRDLGPNLGPSFGLLRDHFELHAQRRSPFILKHLARFQKFVPSHFH